MSQTVGGYGLKSKRNLLEAVFASRDPGTIFVCAYRWLVGHSDYATVILLDSRAEAERKRSVEIVQELLLRKAPLYEQTRDAVAAELHYSDVDESLQTILAEVPLEIREIFWDHLKRTSSPFEVVAATLGLMKAIEKRLGSPLITAFRNRRSPSSPTVIPIESSAILPLPKAGFGTGIVDPERFPSNTDLPDETVLLREYFGRITVTPFTAVEPESPLPGLHVHWSSNVAREEPEWKVALLSILADVGDVNWKAEGGRFRGTELANERVRVRLEWALRICDEFQPDIIVIPELNIDAESKTMLSAWLQQPPRGPDQTTPIIVYGGLHVPDPDVEGCYRNQPGVLTPAREVHWDYWKRFPVKGKLTPHGEEVWENLGRFPQYVLGIDLPFGRLAILVCKDVLMDQTRSAVQQLLPSVLIVPAMTSAASVEDFQSLAKSFASSLRCVTVLCNSSVLQRSPWRRPDSDAPRTLGLIHANTKKRAYTRPPSHELDDDATRAVVGLYKLTASEQTGLEVSRDVKNLSGGEEDALAALRH